VRGAAGRDAAVPGLTTDTNALRAALGRMPAAANVAVCGWAERDAANWQSTPAEILQRLASAQVADVPGDSARRARTRRGFAAEFARR